MLSEAIRDKHTKRVYLSYRNDNETIFSGYVDLIKRTDYVVEFLTRGNLVVIPMNRVLKIKEGVCSDDKN